MDIGEFREFFLTLGGTFKQTSSIGGFGAAKELILYAWKSWLVFGTDFMLSGKGSKCDNEALPFNGTGFKAVINDPELPNLDNASFTVCGRSDLTINVWYNGSKVESGRKLRSNQELFDFPFGALYVHKSYKNTWENTGHVNVRCGGLYSFDYYIGTDSIYYLNLTDTSVDTLTENREGLRWEIREEMERIITALFENKSESVSRQGEIVVYNLPQITKAIETFEDTQELVDTIVGLANGEVKVDSDIQVASAVRKLNDLDQDRLIEGVQSKIKYLYNSIEIPHAFNTVNNYNPYGKNGLKKHVKKALFEWHTVVAFIHSKCEHLLPYPTFSGISWEHSSRAFHTEISGHEIIFGRYDVITSDNLFLVVEVAIHELAHIMVQTHCSTFESERLRIAECLGNDVEVLLMTMEALRG